MLFEIAQIFGFLAFFIELTSFHYRKKSKILTSQTVTCILDLIQYMLLGAFSGVVTKVLAILRNVCIIHKDKHKKGLKWLMYVFATAYIIMGVVTFEAWYSLLPLIAGLIFLFATWDKDEQTVRYVAFIGYILWIIYNVIVMSIFGVVSCSCGAVSTLLAIIRHSKKNKKKKTKKVVKK